MYIVLYEDREQVYGPFPNKEEAEAWAMEHIYSDKPPLVLPILHPESWHY